MDKPAYTAHSTYGGIQGLAGYRMSADDAVKRYHTGWIGEPLLPGLPWQMLSMKQQQCIKDYLLTLSAESARRYASAKRIPSSERDPIA